MGNRKRITNRGIIWELINSCWILLSFIGLSWCGFFFIGRKAKQKKWMIMGLVFLFLTIQPFFFTRATGTILEISIAVFIGSYFAGIILSFIQRKKYLICRDILLSARVDENDEQAMRDTIVQSYRKQNIQIEEPLHYSSSAITQAVQAAVTAPSPAPSNIPVPPVQQEENLAQENKTSEDMPLIDVNRCSERELSELPGVSVVQAKKAVEYREGHNGFSSLDVFFAAAEIKPHFVVQLEEKLICGAVPQAETATRGRKLDF